MSQCSYFMVHVLVLIEVKAFFGFIFVVVVWFVDVLLIVKDSLVIHIGTLVFPL